MTTSLPPHNDIPAVALFIDVDNVGITSERFLNARPDYRALLGLAESYGKVVVAEAFARSRPDCEGQSCFFKALRAIGYLVRTQTAKVMFDGTLKSAPVDMDLAFRVGRAVSGLRVSTVIIVSGDSDFAPICQELRREGVEVIVVGPDCCSSPEIKRAASRFYSISEVGVVRSRTVGRAVAAYE